MNFAFPTETVEEGMATIVVPKLKMFAAESKEHVPSKAPVFYNPRMEMNRDIAVLVLQTLHDTINHELSICEPLTGCGVRGIRLAKEVEDAHKVMINDISVEAAKLVSFNIKKNKVSKKVKVFNEDANLFLSRHAAPQKRFDYADIDPFGSPVPYLDAGLRAVRKGGLLALTATDMAPLCGVHPKACIRKYGGKPLRTEFCHELALRLLVGCVAMAAAKHDIGIKAVFSYSANNYVRTYVALSYGAKEADKNVQAQGYVLYCFECFHREAKKGMFSSLERTCPECGSKLNAAGPLWLEPLWDKQFCVQVQKKAAKSSFRLRKEIIKLLSLIAQEAEAPITYYVVDKLCDRWGYPIPPMSQVTKELKKRGFQSVPTHFNPKALRTNAPARTIKEILTQLSGSGKAEKNNLS